MRSILKSQKGFSHVALVGVAVLLFGVVGTFLIVQSRAATTDCTKSTFKQGINGSSCVRNIQALVNWHINASKSTISVDGNYGPKTAAAVKQVQKTFGLKQDGIVGKQTWNIICFPQMGPGIPSSFPIANARNAGCKI